MLRDLGPGLMRGALRGALAFVMIVLVACDGENLFQTPPTISDDPSSEPGEDITHTRTDRRLAWTSAEGIQRDLWRRV